jgi:hypothetical protein
VVLFVLLCVNLGGNCVLFTTTDVASGCFWFLCSLGVFPAVFPAVCGAGSLWCAELYLEKTTAVWPTGLANSSVLSFLRIPV